MLWGAESSLPRSDVGGRIGAPAGPGVPSVGNGPNSVLLIPPGAPTSAPYDGTATGYEDYGSYPFYSVKRYRTYFNVDTDEVLGRLFRAVLLFFRADFLERTESAPDLYGPFWVAATLVFVSAVTGNYASYINYRAAHGADARRGWYGSVDKVGGSLGLFYGYVFAIGLALFLVMKYLRVAVRLAQVWCAYGYALAVYIPTAFLCVIPVDALRWALLATATATSGTFILMNFQPAISAAAGARAVPLFAVMAGLHAALGLALKLYFFRYPAIPI